MVSTQEHASSLRRQPPTRQAPPRRPLVSFVLATHNRRAVVRHTLEQLMTVRPLGGAYEVIACDNASTDGTPDAIADLTARVLRLDRNAGSCAKAFGIEHARGRYIVFLDDDSHPRAGSVERMIERFDANSRLGAAGFTVHLPDGRLEGGALPGVFLGCGVGFRAEALRGAGGLDATFFMQAEEYDLAFRLAAAGWKVDVFDDLHVEHLKTPAARRTERTTHYDTRNNLIVVARHLPAGWYEVYREDHLQRYAWLAETCGHRAAFECGAWAGLLRASRERWAFRRRRLSPQAFERFYRIDEVAQAMHSLRREGVRRIVLSGFGKNIHAFHRGAKRAGIDVPAIADDRFAAPGRSYRGTPIVPFDEYSSFNPDILVMGDMSPVHAAAAAKRFRERTNLEVIDWYGESSYGLQLATRHSEPGTLNLELP